MRQLIGLMIALFLVTACDSPRPVLTAEDRLDCEKYSRQHIPSRFEIIECFAVDIFRVNNSRSGAYVSDPERGLCFLLTGMYDRRSLSYVPCEKLKPAAPEPK
jgi:hypothetical protein